MCFIAVNGFIFVHLRCVRVLVERAFTVMVKVALRLVFAHSGVTCRCPSVRCGYLSAGGILIPWPWPYSTVYTVYIEQNEPCVHLTYYTTTPFPLARGGN